MKKRMTIADVARDLELDYSTVLRILNKDFKQHKYNPETVKKVVEYAERHNLIKNHVASALKSGKTALVGMCVPDLSSSPFFAELASLISRKLLQHGYKVIISDAMDDPEQELKSLNDFISYNVEGIIMSPYSRLKNLPDVIKDIPMIIVDNDLYDEYDFVGLDNVSTAKLLLEDMATAGIKKIGLLIYYQTEKRVKSFFDAARKFKIEMILPPEGLRKRAFLEEQCSYFQKSGCDGIIGINSNSLKAVVKHAVEKKIKVPESLKISGIGEIPLLEVLMPQVMMLQQPIETYASKVVELLTAEMQGLQKERGEKFLFTGKII